MCSTQCEIPVRPVGSFRLPMRYSTHQLISGALCCSFSNSVMPLESLCRVTLFSIFFCFACSHISPEASPNAAILEAHFLHDPPIVQVATINHDRRFHFGANLAHIQRF